jgi:Ohr subfamily peroxiredoxin
MSGTFLGNQECASTESQTGRTIPLALSSATEETVMPVNVLYKTSATATGGRDGHAATADGSLDVTLATPKELGGAGGTGNNPEQLFAAGYSACFIGAMKFVASQGGPKVPADTKVTATVGIGPRSEGGFGLDIELTISLPGLAPADAKTLVDKAHQVCPYSNATRNNVPVRLVIA